MDSIERSRAALKLEAYDRVSVNPEIDASYAAKLSNVPVGECFIDEKLHAEVLENVFKHHDVDGIYINLCLSKSIIEDVIKTKDGYAVKDTYGLMWNVPYNDVGSVIKRDIKSLDDKRLLTDNPLRYGINETFNKIDKNIKSKYLITPGLTGPFSQVVYLYGLENTLISIMEEPEKLKEILEYRTVLAINWVEELCRYNVNCIWIGEGAASSSVISPKQYVDFVFPYQKKLVDHMKQRNILSIMHICGDINKSLKYIADTGVNGIDIDYLVDLEFAWEQVSGKACLKGNINSAELLSSSGRHIYEISKQKVSRFKDKGLILSTGCLVSRDTPPQNINAMVNASYSEALS